MRLFLWLCLGFCALGSKFDSESTPTDVRAGYFRGRSGTMTFKPTNAQKSDVSSIFLDKTGDFFDTSYSSLSDLKVTDLADMIGSTLGIQPLDLTHSIPQSRMFKKAQANVLISVESLGEETLDHMDLQSFTSPSTSSWGGNTVFKKDLSFDVYPSNSISVAASLVSGQLPSSHGIIDRQWKNKLTGRAESAFSAAENYGQVANLADIISQSFHGQSSVVSFSSDWQQAKLHSVNPNSKYSSIALAISHESGAIENLEDSPITHPLSRTRDQTLDALRGKESLFSSLSPVTASFAQDQVTVSFPSAWGNGNDETSFDLQSKADFAFFAELQYMYELPTLLSSNGLKSDNAPDLFSLTVASTTKLIEKYGRDSPEVRASFHILNSALPKIMGQYYALFDDGVVGEVVLLGSHASAFQTSDTRDLLSTLTSIMPKQEGMQQYFPSLYLDDTQAIRLCQTENEVLPLAVQPYGFSVYCPWLSLATRKTAFAIHPYVLMASAGATNTSNSTVTDDDIQIYQVTLWISIIMAFALYWAVYTIGFMSFKKDTLLYSTFNPGWEDRKRR